MADNNKDDIEKVSPVPNDVEELRQGQNMEPLQEAEAPYIDLSTLGDAPQRREENPFSFKRFLNLNQDRGGARRKEYSPDGTPVLVNTSEMSSMLPDFVQDHLVIEQSYMSSPTRHGPIPFDLPIPAEDRIDPTLQMSLPDFLSDGPIHSQRGDEAAGYLDNHEPTTSNGHLSSPGPSSRNDVERLQREVDNLRRQLHERNRRIHILESEVNLLHNRDARESDSLEYSLQQVENNLLQTSKRMVAAEKAVVKLKADNKMLRARLEMFEMDEGGAAAAARGPSDSYSSNVRNQRLAQDLRGAATAAEAHLRSLMSGIENLRMMASAIEDRPNFDYDFVEGASGPAL